jgi:hypothetical protein
VCVRARAHAYKSVWVSVCVCLCAFVSFMCLYLCVTIGGGGEDMVHYLNRYIKRSDVFGRCKAIPLKPISRCRHSKGMKFLMHATIQVLNCWHSK